MVCIWFLIFDEVPNPGGPISEMTQFSAETTKSREKFSDDGPARAGRSQFLSSYGPGNSGPTRVDIYIYISVAQELYIVWAAIGQPRQPGSHHIAGSLPSLRSHCELKYMEPQFWFLTWVGCIIPNYGHLLVKKIKIDGLI